MNISPKENTFRRKIKTREQLREAIGPRPRDKKVIMCHGTFDLVHPGHIRHLMYAKDHADVLVASLTSDSHINKANFRPFVPQDLRAMNLAALECVDYVIIDDNETPIENLKFRRRNPSQNPRRDCGHRVLRRRASFHTGRPRSLILGHH
jgi:cytidyltransferase-like protein